MLLSMTGFGASTASSKRFRVKCEVLCLNKKNLEVYINVPRNLISLELPLRKTASDEIIRGKLSVNFEIQALETNKSLCFQEDIYQSMLKELKKISKINGIDNNISLSDWMHTSPLWSLKETSIPVNEAKKLFEASMKDAITNLKKMRSQEGKKLQKDIERNIRMLEQKMRKIKKIIPKQMKNYENRLKNRLKDNKDLKNEEKIIFSRFIGIFSEKTDITEELDRLESHFQQFIDFMKNTDSSGRSLNFLVQEILREINTIGSKSPELAITKEVVDMKTLLEQIREQIQNIL